MEEALEHPFLRFVGRLVGTTAFISLAVLLAGYFLHWMKPIQYSNAFFVAGAIPAVVGAYSIFGGSINGDTTSARSASQANPDERSLRLASDISQRYRTTIFLMATGLLLILIAIGIGQFFIPG